MCEKVQLEPRRLARKREKWTDCLADYNVQDKYDGQKNNQISSSPRSQKYNSNLHKKRKNSTSNEAPKRTISPHLSYIKHKRGIEEAGSSCQNLNLTRQTKRVKIRRVMIRSKISYFVLIAASLLVLINQQPKFRVHSSLIIGDSAIEIQEVDQGTRQRGDSSELDGQAIGGGNGLGARGSTQSNGDNSNSVNNVGSSSDGNNIVLGKASGGDAGQQSNSILSQADSLLSSSGKDHHNGRISAPILTPSSNNGESPSSSDPEPQSVRDVMSSKREPDDSSSANENDDRAISGRVVDFELTPAGGHNKAKIKKKKKKEKKMAAKEEKKFKKWSKKKKAEKKSKEMKHMESMKKKKAEGKKGKKKWGKEVHGQKKKGSFKKKKWGKKVKKGKGVKKGKKGKKFLADKGHKNTGFKTVYHKEEWGGSKKWHDIKREKKWDEQSKKWKKKWKKENGKKYKGDHMKKFEKQKKHGKKYKKEKKEKFKKEKKEEFKKGKKMKKEEHMKKKEGGKKKEEKAEKKKKEMKKKKKKKGRK